MTQTSGIHDSPAILAPEQPASSTERERRRDPEQIYRIGLDHLHDHHPRKALAAFRLAHELRPNDEQIMSYYGLCLVLTDEHVWEGIRLCEKAVRRKSYLGDPYLNLGLAYLRCGERTHAHDALARGLRIDPEHDGLRTALARMGIRRPPVVSLLDRGHPINRLAGKLRARIDRR